MFFTVHLKVVKMVNFVIYNKRKIPDPVYQTLLSTCHIRMCINTFTYIFCHFRLLSSLYSHCNTHSLLSLYPMVFLHWNVFIIHPFSKGCLCSRSKDATFSSSQEERPPCHPNFYRPQFSPFLQYRERPTHGFIVLA